MPNFDQNPKPLNPRGNYMVAAFGQAHYYPFGSVMQGRVYSSAAYRFGFNGKEKETDGTTDNYDFGARIYDGRLGRWLSVDPHFQHSLNISVYASCSNTPIIMNDPDGRDGRLSGSGTKEDPYIIKATYAYVQGKLDVEQAAALSTAVSAYNNGGEAFKYTENDQTTYIKYEITVQELVAGTDVSENGKGVLRGTAPYAFTDENGNSRSSLNFVDIGTNATYADPNAYGCSIGNRDVFLNTEKLSSELTQMQTHIDQNGTDPSCTSTSDLKAQIMIKSFIHEIYHNLGGNHVDRIKNKPLIEMSKIEVNYATKDMPASGECKYTCTMNTVEPTKQGAKNLINQYFVRNIEVQGGAEAYDGDGHLYK